MTKEIYDFIKNKENVTLIEWNYKYWIEETKSNIFGLVVNHHGEIGRMNHALN
jgi:hypothetical protein